MTLTQFPKVIADITLDTWHLVAYCISDPKIRKSYWTIFEKIAENWKIAQIYHIWPWISDLQNASIESSSLHMTASGLVHLWAKTKKKLLNSFWENG